MKLHILDLGRCDVDKGRLLAPGVDDGLHILIPIPAFLIETDDGKRILIDTGMHPVHVEDPEHTFREMPGLLEILRPVMKPEDTIEHRLGELGLGLEDLTHVVNSHLHFDHCGQNASITHLPIIVNRQHYEAALELPAFPNEYFDRPELRYEFVEGEQELFQGVRTIQTPGHAPYHTSFLLDLKRSGKVLLCIDAVYIQDNLDHDAWGGQADPEEAKRSAEKLKRIAAEEGARMIYGHDPQQWETLPHAPEYLD